jgi:uncharacterized protein (DUF983 family)
MNGLANICSHCRATRLEPGKAEQAWCQVCGGSGYELTDSGSELRTFVIAMLQDRRVKDAAVDFLLSVKRDAAGLES